jgi:putative ABC transport system ATP-binding protein
VIEVLNLRKSYEQSGKEIEVLKGVTFSLKKGETVAICGQSGSGKSTFLSLLAGLDQPTSGDVKINGHTINHMSEEALAKFRARSLGIIFQHFHLMSHLTAIENVSLPLEIQGASSAIKDAKEALERVGLGHRLNHLPQELSGGECQRVAIARAIVIKPELLLADEPSGNLDNDTGAQVMNLLFDLVDTSQMTMIMVTHNLDIAKRCKRQLTLTRGTLK